MRQYIRKVSCNVRSRSERDLRVSVTGDGDVPTLDIEVQEPGT